MQVMLDTPPSMHQLKLALRPTNSSPECSRNSTQDSLVRMLLKIDCLQEKVSNLLLERIAELSMESNSSSDLDIPHLVMSQFRWLDHVVDSSGLVSKMLEVIGIAQLNVQKEIISCLPEIIDDENHAEVAAHLSYTIFSLFNSQLMEENNDLMIDVLDTMSNLTLNQTTLDEIRSNLLKTLPSIEETLLPVAVKFILQTVESPNTFEILTELRSSLDFKSTFPSVVSSTPYNTGTKNNQQREIELLVLDVIKSSIRFQKQVGDSWIKVIESMTSSSEHKILDIFILFILHSFPSKKKAVESVFRNKIRNCSFDEVLLQGAFGSPAVVLLEFFPVILSLSEVLLHSPEKEISHIGSVMFTLAFQSSNTYGHQEIIASLINHVGSGNGTEIDLAINVLCELADKYSTEMCKFSIFIKGILDYVDNLSLPQIRKVYSILCTLAYCGEKNGISLQDELNIIIRKQLSNPLHKFKRMGVVGALMAVKAIMSNNRSNESFSLENTNTSSVSEYNQSAIHLLEMVKSSTRKTPVAISLFYDELADAIICKELDSKLVTWTNDYVVSDFQVDFIVDVENKETSKMIDGLEFSLQYDIDEISEGGIALNLLPILIKNKRNIISTQLSDDSQASVCLFPMIIAPQFRLFQICEAFTENGKLDGIDALLGCPIFLQKFDMDDFSSFSTSKQTIICDSIFYVVNWMRELVNAFMGQEDEEMLPKVLQRISNIHFLQQQLLSCISALQNKIYQPPPANFDLESVCEINICSISRKIIQKRGRKKTSDKKKIKNGTSIGDSVAASGVPASGVPASAVPASTSMYQVHGDDSVEEVNTPVSLQQVLPYFREFDLKVFFLLQTTEIVSSNEEERSSPVLMEKAETLMLLEDLCRKMKQTFVISSEKKYGFSSNNFPGKNCLPHVSFRNSEEVLSTTIHLLPYFCDHIEAAFTFFQNIISECDGIMDGAKMFTPEADQMSRVMEFILLIIFYVFSWSGFQAKVQRSLLKDALKVFAKRTDPELNHGSLQYILMKASAYILNYIEIVPNLSCAIPTVKIIVLFHGWSDEKDSSRENIIKCCKALLERQWFDPEGKQCKGSQHNEQINYLLMIYFKYSPDVISCLEFIVSNAVPELIEAEAKEAYSKTFSSLNKGTFCTYYRLMLQHLAVDVKKNAHYTNSDSKQVLTEKLAYWSLVIRVFHILVHLIKIFDSRPNLLCCLKVAKYPALPGREDKYSCRIKLVDKLLVVLIGYPTINYGRQVVELFLKHAMPLLDKLFRNQQEDVLNLLKKLQLCTRFLQHVCSHSKVCKDVTLTNHVPFIRKALETLLFRVKAMLAANKCMDAFWLGNLKNRDLQGEEIITEQSLIDSDSETEELPQDDMSDVHEMWPVPAKYLLPIKKRLVRRESVFNLLLQLTSQMLIEDANLNVFFTSLLCSSNQFFTILAVWIDALSSWKTALLLGNSVLDHIGPLSNSRDITSFFALLNVDLRKESNLKAIYNFNFLHSLIVVIRKISKTDYFKKTGDRKFRSKHRSFKFSTFTNVTGVFLQGPILTDDYKQIACVLANMSSVGSYGSLKKSRIGVPHRCHTSSGLPYSLFE
ncbi:Fanconi anemia group D2 protein [Nymphon striatum]|nr:Fanconi anemia group D2 protein [Nymphon striatum]